MKNIFILTLSFALLFISCKKEEDAVTSSNGYTAKVDGDFWRAKSTQASIFNGTIVVVGEASDGSKIVFSLSGDSVGLYAVNENTNSSASYSIAGGKSFTSGGSPDAGGQILIESISKTDNLITGSIELKAVRASGDSVINITNGRFVGLIYNNLPIGLENNNLKVKVNGNNWSPADVSGFVAFKTIYLKALDADGVRNLTFELPELIGPGNYNLNYFTDYKAVYTNITGKKFYAINGNLEIISHNLVKRELEAKFELKAEAHEGGGTVNLSVGEFKIIYE